MKELIKKLAKLYVTSGQQEEDKKIMESSRNLLIEDMIKQSKPKPSTLGYLDKITVESLRKKDSISE